MTAQARTFTFEAEDFFKPGTEEYYEALRSRLEVNGGELPSLLGETELPTFEVFSLPLMKYLPPPEWLIGEWVEQGTMTVVYGPPGSGKTAFLSSLLWAYVSGMPWWFDKRFKFSDAIPVEDRRVLYVLLEGKGMYPQRFEAWQQHEGVTDEQMMNMGMVLDHVHFWSPQMQLDKPQTWSTSLRMLYNTIKEFAPQVVVVDTFQMATAGANENSSDVSTVMSILTDIQRTFNVGTVLVHHPPKDDNNDSPRGHGSITGSATTEVKFKKPDAANVYGFKWTKTRDTARGSLADMKFKMKSAERSFFIEPHANDFGAELAELVPISPKDLQEHWGESKENTRQRWNRYGYHVVDGVVVKKVAEEVEEI